MATLNSSPLAEIKAEAAIITTQMEGLRERERDLSALIDQMQAMRADVQAKSACLEAQLTKLEALKCSINSLPSELLLHIFDLCVLDDTIDGRPPTYRGAAMSVSQVCGLWRRLCLQTTGLWTRLQFECTKSSFKIAELFLRRSAGQPPIEIAYRSSRGSPRDDSIEDPIFEMVATYSSRLRSLIWQTPVARNLFGILSIVNNPAALSTIRRLHLSCETPRITDYALHEERARGEIILPYSFVNGWTSSLEELRLDHIPISYLSSFLFTNLRSVELNSTGSTTTHPPLIPSVLRSFISAASKLEVLVLTQIHILFPNEDVPQAPLVPVAAPSLKHIEWNGQLSYTDLHKLFRFLEFPSLEILDICVDRISEHGVRVGGVEDAIIFNRLKELYIQFDCDFDNNRHESALRCFFFPHLEKLDLINTACPMHGIIPRLEQIFRDPRLPHLTHLTLSRYEISTAQRTAAQAMLGYIPALTYLGLDTCVGVGVILGCLADLTVVTTFAKDGPSKGVMSTGSPRVKVCPRLEILAFWRCNDLEIEDLRAVVTARNNQLEATPRQEQGKIDKISSRDLSRKIKNAQVLRVIKPLRKPRSQQHGEPRQDKGKIDLESPSVTHMDHGVPAPFIRIPTPTANLIHVRIEGCEAVKKDETLSLEELGVLEVVWKENTERKSASS